jgi:hypothetical protein
MARFVEEQAIANIVDVQYDVVRGLDIDLW